MYMCGRVIDQESEQLCICVLGLSIRKVRSYVYVCYVYVGYRSGK